MVYGDNKPFNVGLIVLDPDNIGAWASEQGIDNADLNEDSRVRELIQSEVTAKLSGAKGYERLRNFAILPEDFTLENGMLTPTLKLKRRIVIKNYAELLSGLYE